MGPVKHTNTNIGTTILDLKNYFSTANKNEKKILLEVFENFFYNNNLIKTQAWILIEI